MSYRRRHRWFRRMALGLAFASVMFAGRASVAAAKNDPGTDGSRYVAAGGWSGMVDLKSGIPLSAGIPRGDEQFIDEQSVDVIPYLSHGILTQEDADAVSAQAIHDPYLTDVFVRPGESLGGPDGDAIAFANALKSQQPTVIPYLSQGLLTQADANAAAARAVHDPYPTTSRQGDVFGPDGDEIAFANAIVAAADSLHDPLTAEESLATSEPFVPGVTDFPKTASQTAQESLATSEPFVPGVTDFPKTASQTAALRPDDRADRFAHSDVLPKPQMVSSDSGSTVEWNEALMVGIGALVLVLGLGLAIGYLRRPRLAGL
jgi:hypothetical protein